MAFLLYVQGVRGPQPQVLHDAGEAPVLDDGIRGRVLAQHKLKPGEEELSLFALSTLYPAPGVSRAGEVA